MLQQSVKKFNFKLKSLGNIRYTVLHMFMQVAQLILQGECTAWPVRFQRFTWERRKQSPSSAGIISPQAAEHNGM